MYSSSWVAPWLLILSVAPGAAQIAPIGAPPTAEPLELEPTALERFAAARGAVEVWAAEIGRIEAEAARVVVTAILVRNASATPSTLGGVRLGLEHLRPVPSCDLKYLSWSVLCARPNAALYFEEGSRLDAVLAALEEDRPFDGADLTTYRWQGPNGSGGGLLVGGYGLEGRTMAELAELVALARAALARQPRQ